MLKNIDAGVLNVSYVELGAPSGRPVILLHGFPYDVHAYDEVAAFLANEGARVIVPYLRGYGPTKFLSEVTPRSGQQAALGSDLLCLIEALKIDRPILGGYDWGGRAACIVSALWPDRVRGLVSVNGYNIQNIAASARPHDPEYEHRIWYQYYFHSERGRAGLQGDRRRLSYLLWRLWSPSWQFTQAEFDRTAASFDNADFVEVVIQSYRHRFGLAAGDPALENIEQRIALQPEITVPTIALEGMTDGVMPIGGTREHAGKFAGRYEYRSVDNAGHNLPQEAPAAFARAVLDVQSWTSQGRFVTAGEAGQPQSHAAETDPPESNGDSEESLSQADDPEDSARVIAKKFVHCLELAREKFVLPDPKTEELIPVATAFRLNVASVCQMMVLPAAVADMAYELRRNLDIAEVDITGALSTPPPTDRETEIFAQASEVVWRRIERDSTMPDEEWRRLIHERLKWGAVPLGWVSATRQGSHGLDALFSAFVVGAWTAVETMIADLWETTLNASPNGLVELNGKPKRLEAYRKRRGGAEPFKPDRVEDQANEMSVPPDKGQKKSANAAGSDDNLINISVQDLVAHQLDIKNKMGTILAKKRYNFSKLDSARLAYAEAFWRDSEKIDAAIMSRSLDKLNRVRNVLVHKAGFIDQMYLRGAESMQLPLAAVGSQIPLDGETVVDLAKPAFQAGSDLVCAVDDWLEARKANLNRRATEKDGL